MSLHNIPAWLLTVASLVAGVAISVETGDWTWFGRAGAAVVAIGIVLTSRQIFEHNRRLVEHQRRHIADVNTGRFDLASHDWADENSMRQLIRARTDEEAFWRREFSGFYMLVGGTLVWGFGDLVGSLLA